MKKTVYAFVAILSAVCLFFSGCSGQSLALLTDEEPDNVGISESEEEKETEDKEYPYVPKITTWDMIRAIPVATPDMTEEQLRQICVDFAVLQQNFYWTPTQSLDYLCPQAGGADRDGKLHCKEGSVFGGLPYGGGALSVYSAMDYYDEKTGVLDTASFAGKNTLILSNNCGTAIMWAFARISSTVDYHGTISMVVKNGCIPLGPYTYDNSLDKYSRYETKQICQDNGEQTMYQSYARLKKADGVVTYGNSAGGHTRMILTDAVVVRKSDGTIDGSQSYVTSVEQYSKQTNIEVNGASVIQHGEPDKKYTFREMFNSGYLPFTVKELCGMAKVERAWAKLSSGDDTGFEAIRSADLESNYAIAKVILTAFDGAGNVTYTTVRHVPGNPVRSFALSNLFSARIEQEVKDADRVVIQAFVASGELLTVFDGKIS